MSKPRAPQIVALILALAPMAACAKPVAQAKATTEGAKGITLQDFQARREKKLLAADTDGDGRISRAEFIAAAKPGKSDPAKRFAKLDSNGDGMLDRSEIDAMLARRFQRIDTNGDGVASPQERAAAHANKSKAGASADS